VRKLQGNKIQRGKMNKTPLGGFLIRSGGDQKKEDPRIEVKKGTEKNAVERRGSVKKSRWLFYGGQENRRVRVGGGGRVGDYCQEKGKKV